MSLFSTALTGFISNPFMAHTARAPVRIPCSGIIIRIDSIQTEDHL